MSFVLSYHRLYIKCNWADSQWARRMQLLNERFRDFPSFYQHMSASTSQSQNDKEGKSQKQLRVPYLGSVTLQSAIHELDRACTVRSVRLKLKSFVKCRAILAAGN